MQNSLKLFFTLSLFSLFNLTTLAAEPKMRASFALVGMNMDYREYNDGKILDSEKSRLNDILGFELGYNFYFLRDENSYSELKTDIGFYAGETEYLGSLLGSDEPYGSSRSTTDNQIGNLGVSYIYNYIASERVTLQGGMGLGFRYWLRSLSATQEELYYWLSLRPSLGLHVKLFAGLSIAPKVEYQYGVLPKMYETSFNYNFSLASANIIAVTIPLNYELTQNIDLFVAYLYEEQKIEKSDSLIRESEGEYYKVYEPDSTANNQYLKFGVAFKY